MKPDIINDVEREIIMSGIFDALRPLYFVEDLMRKEHPRKTREIFKDWNNLPIWGVYDNDLNTLRLMIEYLHEYVADKQSNVGLRELMFFTIDRLRILIRGERLSTDRFVFNESDAVIKAFSAKEDIR